MDATNNSTAGRAPIGRQAQARAMRLINVPMRVVLGWPFATPLGGRLMLACIVGRKTGKTYRQPLSYVRQDDVLLTPGGGRWTLNLAAGHPVRLRLRGQDVHATPELVHDLDEIDRLLTIMASANPGVDRFVRLPRGPDGRLARQPLQAAVDHGFRIVRWHLGNYPGPAPR